MRVLLAGATGAIGRRLVPLLVQAGQNVTGTTRSSNKADALRAAGRKLRSSMHSTAAPKRLSWNESGPK